MKKYYQCTVTTHDGRVFDNPLRLGEFVIIGQLLRENKSVLVEIKEISLKSYQITFGL